MSERTTGATDSQIEAAVDRCLADNPWLVAHRAQAVKIIRLDASYLVPPGFAIVPVSPVRADREALAKAAFRGYWDSCERTKGFKWDQAEEHHIWFAVADAVLAALRATPEPERAE